MNKNPATEALKRAVAKGKAIDWSEIAPPLSRPMTDWAGNSVGIGDKVWAIHGGTGERDLAVIESVVGDVLWIRYGDGHSCAKRSFEITKANTDAARAPGHGGGETA